MEKYIIIGIQVTDRVHHANQVQQVLTDYGCNIKTRIGLHETSQGQCSPNGLLLIEIYGDINIAEQVHDKLNAIDGVTAKMMVFGD